MPMIGRAILRLSPIALLVIGLAACGGGGETKTVTVTVTTTGPSTTTPGASTSLRVYFLLNGRVQPVLRTVPRTKAVAGAALNALLEGPTAQERQLGLSSQVSSESSLDVERSGGVLVVHGDVPDGAPLAQVVYTMTQFPNAQTAEVNGKRYTRSSFEDLTPAILVELPLPFQSVSSPMRLAGTANTFEATFEYELRDAAGKTLARHFATATSGSGMRGTFDVTVRFEATSGGTGSLRVWEDSAANGKPIHVVQIPVQIER
jgi:hypothetical protein